MLKLMKYEFRKLRTALLAMLGVLAALEIMFVVGTKMEKSEWVGVSIALLSMLVFLVYAYIVLAGLASYSRELKEKSGYLIFMVPVSPLGVVLSKLLFTAVTALIATGVFGAAAYLDYAYLARKLNISESLLDQINMLLRMGIGNSKLTVTNIGSVALFTSLTVLIEILTAMCTGYLAITLAATLLQNKKGFVQALVSLALFLALNWGANWLAQNLLYNGVALGDSMRELTGVLLKSMGLNAALSAVFIAASAWLLEHKVNL